jgi:DnaJ-class molecular chaperone
MSDPCLPCRGTGKIVVREERNAWNQVYLRETRPCGECGGSGRVHCCEGEQAQPEAADAAQDR